MIYRVVCKGNHPVCMLDTDDLASGIVLTPIECGPWLVFGLHVETINAWIAATDLQDPVARSVLVQNVRSLLQSEAGRIHITPGLVQVVS